MKVFVVFLVQGFAYGSCRVVGVFSTRELAEKCSKDNGSDCEVEEFEVIEV